jgi:predicted small lipoprotein YifL
MKFPNPVKTLAAIMLLATLSACGQRGPLYLPPPDPSAKSTAPATPVAPAAPAAQKTDPDSDKDKKDAAPN